MRIIHRTPYFRKTDKFYMAWNVSVNGVWFVRFKGKEIQKYCDIPADEIDNFCKQLQSLKGERP